MTLRFHGLLILLAFAFAACGDAQTTASDNTASEDEAGQIHAWAATAFAEIECRSNGQDSRRLERHVQPLLRWSNPQIGRAFGDVFLCTIDGYPAALVSLYAWHRPTGFKQFAEFLSLSEEPLKATKDEHVLWNTGAGNLAWRAFESSPIPAATAPARMSQMRSLTSRFDILLEPRPQDALGAPQKLRKLTRPLFRYDNVKAGLIDGAIFAFVLSTDPDTVLLLEARENSLAEKSWHYALARMNYSSLTVRLDGRIVQRYANTREFKLIDLTRPYSVARWPTQSLSIEPAESIAEEQR